MQPATCELLESGGARVDPTSNGDNEKRERGPLLLILGAAVLFLPIVYVLSSGPAVWLMDHGYVSDIIGLLYWPLHKLRLTFPLFKTVWEWYVELWR
jgi:hypothetical protein